MITRRRFLGSSVAALAFAASDRPLSATPAQAGARQPNVILIVLDDLGSIDAHCYGSNDLITPNIDGLAAAGIRFTQLYSTAPLCSPSRASIMTGRYPQRAGLPGNADSKFGGRNGLGQDEVTLAQMFRSAGYATAHVGKWHLGFRPELMPNAKGFEQSFGHMGGCIDNYSHFFFWDGPNRHDLWENGKEVWREGQNIGDLSVDKCTRFLEESKDRPFFLYWAINQPHYPLQGRAKWRDTYRDLPSPRSMYAASVSTLDELIGKVVTKVRDLGLEQETIIVLQSDHGHSTEERSFGGGGNAGPYRGAKGSLFDGGVRVVSTVRWPGTLPQGVVRDQMVSGLDWMPTLAELTGVPLPKRRIDGKSMVPILHSATEASRHPVLNWQYQKQWAVREGGWKLLVNPVDTSNKAPVTEADRIFLSDMSRDVTEMTNLASQNPEIVKRLTAYHQAWEQDVTDHS